MGTWMRAVSPTIMHLGKRRVEDQVGESLGEELHIWTLLFTFTRPHIHPGGDWLHRFGYVCCRLPLITTRLIINVFKMFLLALIRLLCLQKVENTGYIIIITVDISGTSKIASG